MAQQKNTDIVCTHAELNDAFSKGIFSPHNVFKRNHVIIIDLDDTGLEYKDLLCQSTPEYESEMRDILKGITQANIGLCTIRSGVPKTIDVSIMDLTDKFKASFDFHFVDPTKKSMEYLKDAEKTKMLGACAKAYPKGTQFYYLGKGTNVLNQKPTDFNLTTYPILDRADNTQSKVVQLGFMQFVLRKTLNHIIQNQPLKSHQSTAARQAPTSPPQRSPATKKQATPPQKVPGPGISVSVPAQTVPRPNNVSSAPSNVPYTRQSNRRIDMSAYRPGQFSNNPPLVTKTAPSPGAPAHSSISANPEILSATAPTNSTVGDDENFNNYLINPAAKTASLGFGEWFIRRFIKAPLLTDTPDTTGKSNKDAFVESLKNLLSNLFFAPFKALLLIFPFEGFDPIEGTISYAAGADKPEPYLGDSFREISIKLLIASFLGFPSRAIKGPNGPTITFKQILKNFVGGIDYDENTPLHKKRLQLWGIPLKGLVFLPIKIALFPLKAVLNGIKLITEFLPWLATSLSFIIYRAFALGAYYSWQGLQALRHRKSGEGQAASGIAQLLNLPVGFLFVLSLVLGIATAPLFLAHVACRGIMVIGRAITSPLLSFRMAYAYGSELKLPFRSETVQRRVAKFIGGLAAGISIAITIISWAIIFPLFVNYVMTQMPTVMSIINSFLNSQAVVNTLAALHNVTTAVGAFLHTVFGPIITGLSHFIGVQITYTAILTVFIAPVCLGFTHLADKLANRWANWHKDDKNPAPDSSKANNSDQTLTSTAPAPSGGRSQVTAPTMREAERLMKETNVLLGELKHEQEDLERRANITSQSAWPQKTPTVANALPPHQQGRVVVNTKKI